MDNTKILKIPVFYKHMVKKPLNEYIPPKDAEMTAEFIEAIYQTRFVSPSVFYKPISKIFLIDINEII